MSLSTPRPWVFRRAAFAAFYGMVLFLVLGGVLGFAVAGADSPNGLPQMFGVAPPHEGDRASYSIQTFIEEADGSLEAKGEPRRFMEFEWQDAVTIVDASLRPRVVNPVRVEAFDLDSRFGTGANTYFYAGDDPLPLASHGRFSAAHASPMVHGVPLPSNVRDRYVFEETRLTASPNVTSGVVTPFCGVRNSLQDEPRRTDRPFVLFQACDVSFQDVWVRKAFHAVAVSKAVVGDHTLVAFEVIPRLADGSPITVWFDGEIPYPVQYWLRSYPPYDGFVAITLTQFHRGSESLADDGRSAVEAPTPRFDFAPRTTHVFDETGTHHAFPFSQALRLARENPKDPSLRDFFDRHPGAYVHGLAYSEGLEHPRSWMFTVTDGRERINVTVRQNEEDGWKVQGQTIDTSLYPDDTSFSYGPVERATSERSPNALPANLPTLASLENAWRAISGDPRRANSWSFVYGCWNRKCPGVDYSIGIGVRDESLYWSVDPARGFRVNRSLDSNLLGIELADGESWDPSPRLYGYHVWSESPETGFHRGPGLGTRARQAAEPAGDTMGDDW